VKNILPGALLEQVKEMIDTVVVRYGQQNNRRYSPRKVGTTRTGAPPEQANQMVKTVASRREAMKEQLELVVLNLILTLEVSSSGLQDLSNSDFRVTETLQWFPEWPFLFPLCFAIHGPLSTVDVPAATVRLEGGRGRLGQSLGERRQAPRPTLGGTCRPLLND
jgi:hypothetical protein